MNKTLLVVLVSGAFSSAAFAQSSVTVYGKLDEAVGKAIGSKTKQLADTANQSRIGFRGQEDLGNGLGAFFVLEHRLSPDTGTAYNSAKFWQGGSYLGLKTNVGTVTLGRQYTSDYQNVRNQIDPFAGETLAALREIGTAGGAGTGNPGTIGQPRFDKALKYSHTFSGFTVSADIASRTQVQGINAAQALIPLGADSNRPWSAALSYAKDGWWAGIGYEDSQNTNDKLLNLGGRFKVGPATLSAGYATGRNQLDAKVNGVLVGAIVNVGAGDIKLGYAGLRSKAPGANDWTTQNSRFGVGYHYNLSKRTKVFVDIARDSHGAGEYNAANSLARTEKNAYDLGLQHNF